MLAAGGFGGIGQGSGFPSAIADLLAAKLTQRTAGSRIRTAKSENAISLRGFFMDEPSLRKSLKGLRRGREEI